MKAESFEWFVGIDWGSERHHACVLDRQGDIAGERSLPHSGAGLAELGDWLLSIVGAANTVAVAIEVPHGPVVDSLIDRGFVVYTINPKQLDRLRDRFSVAGAKDDRRDSYILADGVRTDRRLLRRLSVADPRIIELRAWSRLAEELTEERVRLSNRVTLQRHGFSSFGPWHRHRRRHDSYVSQLSSSYLSNIAFAASIPSLLSVHCENQPSKLQMVLPRQRAFIYAR
jgi:Transposase